MILQAQLENALLSPSIPSVRASELVAQVSTQVKLDPEKFSAFLEALEKSDVSQKLVRDVREKYENHIIIITGKI